MCHDLKLAIILIGYGNEGATKSVIVPLFVRYPEQLKKLAES